MTVKRASSIIAEDAARWLLRLDRDNSEATRVEFEAWLAADLRCRGAFLKAEAVWISLDLLATAEEHDGSNERPMASRDRDLSGTRRKFLVAAGVGGAIAASVSLPYVFALDTRTYETAVGELRRVPLSDRSAISINTASRIRVSYEKDRRLVDMETGEAWFSVAKDIRRPFIVTVGQVCVEAVGTAFSVRRRADGAEIIVTEGTVRAWVEGKQSQKTAITAGSSAFIADNALVRRETSSVAEIQRKLAWRAGRLELAGETLDEAVSEFNRYAPVPIEVEEGELGGKRLYGVFRLDDSEAFAKAAALTLGGATIVRPDKVLIVKRR